MDEVNAINLAESKRDIALSALYELDCWAADLQRLAAELEDDSHAIIRGIAVRIEALGQAVFHMVTDDEGSVQTIMDAAKTVYGSRLAAVGNASILAALNSLGKTV